MNLTTEQETELIHLAQNGTPSESNQAVNQLLEAHRTALYQFAMKALGDHDKADDAVQGTFVVAWQKLSAKQYTPDPLKEHHFQHWLLSICKNHNLKVKEGRLPDDKILYKVKPSLHPERHYMPSSSRMINKVDLIVTIEQDRELDDLARCIEMLPRRQRRVFSLYCKNYTPQEISEFLNLSLKSVQNRISEAKKIIRTGRNSAQNSPEKSSRPAPVELG